MKAQKPELRTIALDDEARALVDAYGRRYGLNGYVPRADGEWRGVYEDGRLTGVGSYVDMPDRRIIRDWYVVDGRPGLRASAVLWRHFRERGVLLVATVLAANKAMVAFAKRYPVELQGYILLLNGDAY